LQSPRQSGLLSTSPYRADIDGLRAVSILLVIGYHAQWIPGGFVGVDIFFVISGFLITRIILTQARDGTFSSLDFYARRVRRIFPALIAVLVVTYVTGWFVLLPKGFSLLGENIAASAVFASNLFQLTQAGYFAPDAADNPLLHLWSLGIEEQFYIFWPPVLLMIFKSKRRPFWMATIAVVSFSAGLMIFFGYKAWAFYSPASRAWELLAGGMIADWYINRPEPNPRPPGFDNLFATIGIVAILLAAVLLDADSLFPGLYALPPVLGAGLIIVSPNSWINRNILSIRPMVLTGWISYPLYLWHWPLLCYLSILRNGVPNLLEICGAIAVADILAWLTFYFVEIPFRRQPNAVLKLSFALIAVGMAGILTITASGFSFRFSPEIRDIAELDPYSNSGLRNECFLEKPGTRFSSRCIEPGEKPLLFLWGDSTAAALSSGLEKAEKTFRFRLAFFGIPGCPPILEAKCDVPNAAAFDFVRSSTPDIVLLHAMWDRTDNLDKLRETIRRLKAINVPRIVILGPVPVWKRALPHTLVNFYRFQHIIADSIATGVSGTADDERMESFSRSAGVEYISAWHLLCNSEGCMTRVGPTANEVVTTDNVHLSNAGSIFLAEAVGRSLFPQPGNK
jgi:peptidoglycan/LPS O-acetylase OafA/YrhL